MNEFIISCLDQNIVHYIKTQYASLVACKASLALKQNIIKGA